MLYYVMKRFFCFFLRFLRGILKKFKRLPLLGRALHVPKCPSFLSLFFSFLLGHYHTCHLLIGYHGKKKKAKRKNQSKYLPLVAGFFTGTRILNVILGSRLTPSHVRPYS